MFRHFISVIVDGVHQFLLWEKCAHCVRAREGAVHEGKTKDFE